MAETTQLEFLGAMARLRQRCGDRVELAMDVSEFVAIIAGLNLAIKHPCNQPGGETPEAARVIRGFLARAIDTISRDEPVVREVLGRGITL